jgi:predicted nucleic acid-binding Zn ribbon protein
LQESIRVLRSVWSQLVGPSISLYSEPGFIKEGILYVFVSQAGWLSELERNRRSLLFKIENQYAEMNIRRLQFELRRPD